MQAMVSKKMHNLKLIHSRKINSVAISLGCLLLASSYKADAGDYYVVKTQELTANGGRVSWSRGANNIIAYDQQGSSGFYDIWTMNPDGSNQTCLTCGKAGVPAYNKGNANWDPSGNYLVFEAQRGDLAYPSDPDATQNVVARPGAGANNVVYIMDSTGTNYYEVPASENGVGILEPYFSHDGTKLIWSQLVDAREGVDGQWEIQYASFTPPSSPGGAPTVTLLNTFTPGVQPAYYETHGFSLDDSTIFFSGIASGQSSVYGTDIYSYNLNTGAFTDLTNTSTYWDEHSRPSPVEEKLFFVSSYGTASTPAHLELDGWTMNYDGSDKKRITWLQDPASPMSMPGYLVSENDWSPDGTQEVIYLNYIGTTTTSAALGSQGPIYLLTFAASSTTSNSGNYTTFPQAPDGLATTFGTNLSDTSMQASGTLTNALGSTAVTVTDVAGTARAALLVYASPTQVNWIVPTGSAYGPATVTVLSHAAVVGSDVVDIEPVGPAIFTAGGSGSGAPAAYVTDSAGGVAVSTSAYNCSASPCTTNPINVSSGEAYLVLYATGVRHQSSVVALIGPNLDFGFTQMNVDYGTATQITPSYAGAQNQFGGLDQLNLLLPSGLAGSGTVYLQLIVDGVYTSNTVQLNIQ